MKLHERGEDSDDERGEEIVLAQCPSCGTKKKLCFFKGDSIRNTYCPKCNISVYWCRMTK